MVVRAPGPDRSPGPIIRLFADHETLDAGVVAGALGSATVDALVEAGLLARHDASVVARFGIERWGTVVVLHDWPEWAHDPDYVMGITNSARSLVYVTPRRRVGRTLDLGTGSGIQALLAAAHSDQVIATDVNERAITMARASVLLNDIDSVEVRAGSWFAPVEDETFDLVVSNPPFVISPEDRFTYRDGGVPVDELCGLILEAIPAHLADGGFAVMMAQWARRTGDEWWSAPKRWLSGTGADGWPCTTAR